MRNRLNKKNIILLLLIFIPILITAQYYLYKHGILQPIIRGVEIQISNGDYIEEIDQYVVKLNDEITLSSGEYIHIPTYAKEPKLDFKILSENKAVEAYSDDSQGNGSKESNILDMEDNNILIAKNEGIATIGVMKGTRVLRKANIKVVDPKVENLIVATSNDLNYVGDTTKIETVVDVDYDKFKEKETATYESSNEDILKINGDEIEAVGVGKASIHVKAKNKEEVLTYNISAKVSKIDIEKVIQIEEGQTKKLSPKIITSPKGLTPPNITYELVSKKLPAESAIHIDKYGNITGNRIGEEEVKITCGNKSVIVTIKVVESSLTNANIENLVIDNYEIVDEKLHVSLSWDYLDKVDEYEIYMRNNSLSEETFKNIKSIKVDKDELVDNRVKVVIEVDLIEGKIPHLSIYVAGKTKHGSTNGSNIVNIIPPEDDIGDLEVKNLEWNSDAENKFVQLTWQSIGLEGAEYSIYIKNNLAGDTGFKLLASDISTNDYIMPISGDKTDLEVYVKANIGDKYSKHSNTIHVTIGDSEGNEGEDGNEGENESSQ